MTTDQPISANRPKSRRRWYQFSLRTLVVVMLLVSIGFAWLGINVQRRWEQRRAIKALEAAGATVMYELPRSFFARSEWLQSILGDEVLLDVLTVGIPGEFGDEDMVLLGRLTQLNGLCLSHTQVTDNGLEHLRGLEQFTTLDLSETQVTDNGLMHLQGLTQLEDLGLEITHVTDNGLEHLRGMTQLSTLNLGLTRVTDEGLVHLRGLTHLKQLDIFGTQVTDAGLKHLHGLTQLTILRLDNTQVTDAGVADLKEALPNLQVFR